MLPDFGRRTPSGWLLEVCPLPLGPRLGRRLVSSVRPPASRGGSVLPPISLMDPNWALVPHVAPAFVILQSSHPWPFEGAECSGGSGPRNMGNWSATSANHDSGH
jgi:hypothetical protein